MQTGLNLNKNKALDRSHTDLNTFFDTKYFAFAKATKRRSQLDLYVFNKHIRPVLGDQKLADITSEDIDQWKLLQINDGYKPATVNKHSSMLNRMLNVAVHWNYLDRNPFHGIAIKKLPVGDHVQRFLTESEISRLLGECKRSSHPYLYLFAVTLLLTGARKSEWRLAKWRDVDLKNRELFVAVSKSGRSRKVMLSDDTLVVLEQVKQTTTELGQAISPDSWIFPNPRTGKPYTSFHIAFDRARVAAALPQVRMHDLRHTYASLLINHGASIYEVQQLLGHHHISMTERYAHLFPNTLKERVDIVANAIKVDLRHFN
ncbi:MAG: site-specific integrase [Marivivens sp.]|nr:site-specific integrase [Marivivens sp.]